MGGWGYARYRNLTKEVCKGASNHDFLQRLLLKVARNTKRSQRPHLLVVSNGLTNEARRTESVHQSWIKHRIRVCTKKRWLKILFLKVTTCIVYCLNRCHGNVKEFWAIQSNTYDRAFTKLDFAVIIDGYTSNTKTCPAERRYKDVKWIHLA